MDQLIGQTVGNYRVTQKLGEGGMGSVYLAEHPTIGKKVALKVLHAEFSTNPEVAERFFTEAKAVNAIGHPNIVDIVDYGVIQAGQDGRDRLVYFIMEYLNGVTLAQALLTQAPLAPERALTISLQVADALAASHKTQIVHRDLKPDNIILINRGREADFVKLLDFGIAKLTGNDGMSSHKTRTGLVLGTPAYMSPEQCEGRATVDHRTDIYALGVVLYEMLTGRVPFIGSGYGEILVQHLTQQPAPPSQYRMMSPHVEQIVLKALEKRPDLRYPTMDEFMRAMADPVGYVESHGGLAGFLGKQLMPSTSSTPVPLRLTPAPLTMSTPVPGTPMTGMHTTPVPGALSTPTTLGASAGQVQPAKSKTPFIVAGAATVVAAAVAMFFVLKGTKHNNSANAGSGSGSSEIAKAGSGSAQAPQPDPPPNAGSGSATVAANTGSAGSAAVVTNPAAGSGSAATGSNTPPPNTNTGSADNAVAAMTKVTINSTPPGADIYVNGVSVNKKTPAELTLKRELMKVALRMKGFEELKKDVTPAGDAMSIDVSLKKAASSSTTQGKGSGSGKGKGKGSGKSCDTCLERPD